MTWTRQAIEVARVSIQIVAVVWVVRIGCCSPQFPAPNSPIARNPPRMLVCGTARTDLVVSACHCADVACTVHCICRQEPPRPEDVFISGTDGVSLASGFHYYLKYVANRWGSCAVLLLGPCLGRTQGASLEHKRVRTCDAGWWRGV